MADGCYVYAILPRGAPLPARLAGFGGPLTAVRWRALAAATSFLRSIELRATPAHLLRHEAVVEALRQYGPALPARFGTVLSDPEAVARALARSYAVLVADMARLGDKVELDIAVLWDATSLGDGEPGRACGGASGRHAATTAAGPGTRYLQARLAEHREEALQRSSASTLARELDATLLPLTLESRWALAPSSRLALNVAYLLEPPLVGAFREAFEGIRRVRPNHRFLLSGPWPPYSFVTSPREFAGAPQMPAGVAGERRRRPVTSANAASGEE